MSARRIAFVGGYTAGHVLPMIAVAEAYRKRFDAAQTLFLGTSDGPEATLLARHGFTFHAIDGAPLHGAAALRERWRAYWSAGKGFVQARKLLADAGAELVVGFGGYVTAGALLAARSLGIATAIFEANAIPGKTNRTLRRFSDLQLVGLEAATAHAGWQDAVVSGYPLRSEIARLATHLPDARRPGPLRILVTAGSRGSAFLNAACPQLAAGLRQAGFDLAVRHQAGVDDATAIEAAYRRHGIAADVEPFIVNMAAAYEAADLVVCGAGAGTLSEVAALGLPALVVPIDGVADDHQASNAALFASRANAVFARRADWDPVSLARRLASLLGSGDRRSIQTSGEFVRPHAAAAIVEHCERLLARKRAPSVALRPAFDPRESASL